MSDWTTIGGLGAIGMEPDKTPVHKAPQSLDLAVNVRAIGPNLANAGGYKAVAGGGFPS
jgi:hypothetical protein